MNQKRVVSCPGCNKPMLAAPQGCGVSIDLPSEGVSENTHAPKASRLHAMALADMVEQGMEDDLRHALLQTRLAAAQAWAKETNRSEDARPVTPFITSRSFQCPHCQAELNLLLDIAVVEAILVRRVEGDISRRVMLGVDRRNRDFIALCKELGVLKSFEEALREQHELMAIQGTKMYFPKSMEQCLDHFLHHAQRGFPSNHIFHQISAEFGGKSVQYWRAEGVGVITVDDQIFRFVPSCLFELKPKSKRAKTSALQKVLVKPGEVERKIADAANMWVRSRYGYVPLGHNLFLNELRQRSKGSFANPSV